MCLPGALQRYIYWSCYTLAWDIMDVKGWPTAQFRKKSPRHEKEFNPIMADLHLDSVNNSSEVLSKLRNFRFSNYSTTWDEENNQ